MSLHKQSRKTQRALERALFGPGPRPTPVRRKKGIGRPPQQEASSTPPQKEFSYTPGDCVFCGNVCDPAYEPWTCDMCGVTYPVADVRIAARALLADLGEPAPAPKPKQWERVQSLWEMGP